MWCAAQQPSDQFETFVLTNAAAFRKIERATAVCNNLRIVDKIYICVTIQSQFRIHVFLRNRMNTSNNL
jgi:hypothetical protein